jgi:hypothetical protein
MPRINRNEFSVLQIIRFRVLQKHFGMPIDALERNLTCRQAFVSLYTVRLVGISGILPYRGRRSKDGKAWRYHIGHFFYARWGFPILPASAQCQTRGAAQYHHVMINKVQ